MGSLQSTFSLDEMTAYQVEFIITYRRLYYIDVLKELTCLNAAEINCVE